MEEFHSPLPASALFCFLFSPDHLSRGPSQSCLDHLCTKLEGSLDSPGNTAAHIHLIQLGHLGLCSNHPLTGPSSEGWTRPVYIQLGQSVEARHCVNNPDWPAPERGASATTRRSHPVLCRSASRAQCGCGREAGLSQVCPRITPVWEGQTKARVTRTVFYLCPFSAPAQVSSASGSECPQL